MSYCLYLSSGASAALLTGGNHHTRVQTSLLTSCITGISTVTVNHWFLALYNSMHTLWVSWNQYTYLHGGAQQQCLWHPSVWPALWYDAWCLAIPVEQLWVLHDCSSFSETDKQPGTELLVERDLIIIPLPQVFEQVDHSDQSVREQFTVNKGEAASIQL